MTIPKFRAWDRKHEKMLGWEQIKSELTFKDIDETNFYIMRRFSFMLSTGMKDKNSVDIYDDDIVAVDNGDFLEYGRVFYSKKMACYRVEFENYDFNLNEVAYCFVCGNVYENPELVEEE